VIGERVPKPDGSRGLRPACVAAHLGAKDPHRPVGPDLGTLVVSGTASAEEAETMTRNTRRPTAIRALSTARAMLAAGGRSVQPPNGPPPPPKYLSEGTNNK